MAHKIKKWNIRATRRLSNPSFWKQY